MENVKLEKTIVLTHSLEKRINVILELNPEMSFNMIVNQALEEWLSPQVSIVKRESFIIDESKGSGPRL